MSVRHGIVVAVALGVLVALLVGCGPKPPCAVPPSEVKDAQAKTAQIEASLSQVQTEKAGLDKELAEKQAALSTMPGRAAELQKQLDNLKKGSGR
jgi:peptidoglycan hydrolase CwlO-like protein